MSGDNSCLYPVKIYPFDWTIHNFSRPDKDFFFKQSSTFPSTPDEFPLWSLKIYPAGSIEAASKNYISLYIRLERSRNCVEYAEFEFDLINADDKKELTMKYGRPQSFIIGQEIGFARFFAWDELLNRSHQLLPNGALTISGQITSLDQDEFKIANGSKALVDMELPKYFAQLFKSQKLTDTIFCIKGIEIKAHKAILAASSEVFRAMFETEMQRKSNNKLEIIDIEFDVFKAMLNFIYTDEAPKSNMAMKLMVAADKYALDRLKALCEKEICSNITAENAAEVLYYADLHRCAYLKNRTLDFIGFFSKIVIETEGWKSLERTHPNLIAEANEKIRIRKI